MFRGAFSAYPTHPTAVLLPLLVLVVVVYQVVYSSNISCWATGVELVRKQESVEEARNLVLLLPTAANKTAVCYHCCQERYDTSRAPWFASLCTFINTCRLLVPFRGAQARFAGAVT